MLDARCKVAAALFVLAAGAARAELAPIEVVSFDEAVRRAIDNNRDVQRAATAIAATDALRRRSKAAWLPSVQAFATETILDSEVSFGGSVAQPKDQFAVRGLVLAPLYAPAEWAATRQAGDQVEVAELAGADVRKQVAVSAAQAYLAVIAQRRQVEVDETARDNAKAQLDFAQTRFEGGAGSRLNALRAAEVLATDEVLLEKSRLELRLAQEALGLILAADRPVDALEEPSFDVPAAADELDLSARTDIRLFTRRTEAADRVLSDSWRDWMPTLDAEFDPAWVDPAGAFEADRSWRAVFGLRFPIYLGGQRRADKLFRSALLDEAAIDLDQARLDAKFELRVARAVIEAAERGLAQARLAAESAGEVLKITEVAFRAGATTNIELIDAQRRARDNDTAVGIAADLLRQAKLGLLVALGRFP